MEADKPARRDRELRLLRPEGAAVEDHARVGAPFVSLQELDDSVPADLLLAVGRNPQVNGQAAVVDKELRRFQYGIEQPFVVCDAAPIRPAVADVELERRRLPLVERRRWLHVEVAVREDGRRVAAVRRRRNITDEELAIAERDELGLPARALDELDDPLAGAPHVVAMRRIRAHRRNRDELP